MASPNPRWLNDDEQATWRALLLATQMLDEALDQQLQRDVGIPHAHYAILVTLSEAPDRTLRMSDVAATLHFSPSRTTHAVASLEKRSWVRRRPCPDDKRGQLAALTDEGMAVLEAAAPGHVEEVRRCVFDNLTPTQSAHLRALCHSLTTAIANHP
jgi:DNA-binding MarR family transcriptional regulator